MFFHPDTKIMTEAGCEPHNSCDTDGLTFKSFTLRWLAITTQLVPDLAPTIWPYIQASAQGAAGQCDGDGDVCGYHWDTTVWDGSTGVGQQMSALAAIQANMITVENLFPPLTLDTGATSKGNANLPTGTGETGTTGSVWLTRKITTGDKAGAGILTALLLAYSVGGAYWLCSY